MRVLYDARYHDAGLLLALLLTRLVFRLAGQLDFQLLLSDGRLRPATVSYLVGGVAHAAAMLPLALFFGATGVAASVILSTALLTTAQSFLAPILTRGVVSRLATAGAWTAAAVVASVLGEKLAVGFAS